jgi:GxxExxY protein
LLRCHPVRESGQADRSHIDKLTYQVIGAAFRVSNALGAGFLEGVYERALARELADVGLRVERQAPVDVSYKGESVGKYFADLLVEDSVIVELKVASGLDHRNYQQCVHYLAATKLRICLLLNFGRSRLEYRRIVRGY